MSFDSKSAEVDRRSEDVLVKIWFWSSATWRQWLLLGICYNVVYGWDQLTGSKRNVHYWVNLSWQSQVLRHEEKVPNDYWAHVWLIASRKTTRQQFLNSKLLCSWNSGVLLLSTYFSLSSRSSAVLNPLSRSTLLISMASRISLASSNSDILSVIKNTFATRPLGVVPPLLLLAELSWVPQKWCRWCFLLLSLSSCTE